LKIKEVQFLKNQLSDFIARCRKCKSKVTIPDQGPCTDLEYREYLEGYQISCKCGKKDWELLV
jgi:hypothetical protein